MSDVAVRAVHGAVAVRGLPAPLDTIHYRIFHPARRSGDDVERLTGEVPADPARAPWPVVIVLNGINTGPEGYRWLATDLAARGYAVVTSTLVGETLPGTVGLTPGIDLDAARAGTYPSRPTASALAPLRDALVAHQGDGPLAGLLDLDRVALFGHSAGGTVALQSSNPDWVPGLRAVVTYGAHTMASTMLGWPESHVLPVPGDLPTLLLGGELDGVVSASADRYRDASTASTDHDPLTRTFHEGLRGERGDQHLAVLAGATHTTILDPPDDTTARGFLDPPPQRDPVAIRSLVAALTGEFLDDHLRQQPGAAGRLRALLDDRDAVARAATR